MTVNNANESLERYFAGETSLAEEADLRAYFTGGDVHPTLVQYAPLFAYWDLAATAKPPLKTKPRRHLGRWLSTAAAAVLLLFAANTWLHQQPEINDNGFPIAQAKTIDWSKYEVTDEKEAYRVLRAALKTASTELNRAPGAAIREIREVRSALR